MDPERKTKLETKAVHELKEYFSLPSIFGYFWRCSSNIRRWFSLSEHISFAAHGVALINALVLGKFLLIAKAFHPGRQVDDKPLIYPTLLKSAILAITVAILKGLEEIIVGHFHGKSVTESIADLGGGSGKAILIEIVMLFVVLIPLTGFGELGRVVGEEKLHALFLRPRDNSKPLG